MKMRKCNRCRLDLPLDDEHFFRDRGEHSGGFRYTCKECQKAYNRAYKADPKRHERFLKKERERARKESVRKVSRARREKCAASIKRTIYENARRPEVHRRKIIQMKIHRLVTTGKIQKPPTCSRCGATPFGTLPLCAWFRYCRSWRETIRWVCLACHRALDRAPDRVLERALACDPAEWQHRHERHVAHLESLGEAPREDPAYEAQRAAHLERFRSLIPAGFELPDAIREVGR